MQIKEIHLPPISTETEQTEPTTSDYYFIDRIALEMEYRRCFFRKDYQGAEKALTQLIALPGHDFDSQAGWYAYRAQCYLLEGNFDAAEKDLALIGSNVSLSTEYQIDLLRGMIQKIQGKETTYLHECADRGNSLALLLLQEPENLGAPKTEWLLLSAEDRIQKLLAGRYYAQAIEQLDQMGASGSWFSTWSGDLEAKWLALRGACYALRGNLPKAAEDYARANEGWGAKHYGEEALVYAMAGQKEDALKLLQKGNSFDQDITVDLLRLIIEG